MSKEVQAVKVLAAFPDPVGITVEVARELELGDVLHYSPACGVTIGPRGGHRVSVYRWRVNGRVKLWKRDLGRFEVPLKHGLYACGYLTDANAGDFHLASQCPRGIDD